MSEPMITYGRTKNTKGIELGKLPPQAVELEEAVLGAAMLEKNALAEVIDLLKPANFYKEAHALVWEAVTDLFRKGEPVDILTVTKRLREQKTLDKVGGPSGVTSLTNKVASSANLGYHAKIVLQEAMKRDIIHINQDAINTAYEGEIDVFEMLDSQESKLFELSNVGLKRGAVHIQEAMSSSFESMNRRMKRDGVVTGIDTGFALLNEHTSGWQPTDLVIIAARPGMGKSAFMSTIMRSAAIQQEVPTLVFSLEMSAEQLSDRMMSAEAHVASEAIRKGTLSDKEYEMLVHNTAKMSRAPIFIDESAGMGIVEMRAKSRRMKQKHGIGLIVVDYLQLMSGERSDKYSGKNREQEIASISRGLKHIAKELNVPVIALSQLSRGVEQRGGDKKPMLSDLRESGSIEQDADMVTFLWRPEYYSIESNGEFNFPKGYTELIIAKNRHGALADVPLTFIAKHLEFIDLNNKTEQSHEQREQSNTPW